MSTRPFDTYDYVEELTRGGFTKTQAEANMRALVKTLDFTLENKLATKDELQNVIVRLDQFENKLDEFETKFVTKSEFNTAITGLEKEIQQVEYRLDTKIDQVEHRLDTKIQRLDHKIDKVFLKTVVINGISTSSIITIACSVMTFLIK